MSRRPRGGAVCNPDRIRGIQVFVRPNLQAPETTPTMAPPASASRAGSDAPLRLVERARPPRSLSPEALAAAADALADAPAEEVVRWAVRTFGEGLVASTSFGIHAAATLHLVTRVWPRIPVVWVDTGYLPPETYRFAEALTRRLDLNLHVAQSPLSPARMEALHGRLWESDDPEDLDRYHRIRKVEPMQRALAELGATAWVSGLRADQTRHREALPRVGVQGGRAKILPILPWSTRDVFRYLKRHDLPLHPLFEQGYASVGDWHSSRPVTAGDEDARDTRFGGRRQECGLHLELDDTQAASLDSSGL
ncbi:MAG: phosphoadenylyl-sulfate reductase [Myxococcota bacterium]|nr:phosphoadenylyl-sulfate reductase [Myxococcota bacterium]